MTFSLLGFDRRNGTIGSAVASRSIAVGGTVAYSRVGVGAVNTQNHAHLSLGERVLDEMERGSAPEAALEAIISSDPGADVRQLIVMDSEGRVGSFSGADCHERTLARIGRDCIAAGNYLARSAVVDRMVHTFENTSEQSLDTRLLQALEAGQEAGGDRRGRQAAAIKVVPATRDRPVAINIDLRVDDHPAPLVELRRLYTLFRAEFD